MVVQDDEVAELADLDDDTLIRTIDRFLMFYVRTADRLQRTASWFNNLDGGIDYLRGVIVDDTRLTSDDASAHNFGVTARYQGVTAGAFYFINLEKGPEIPDDFFRFVVSYDF